MMVNHRHVVYGLHLPDGPIRYVGATSRGLHLRMLTHFEDAAGRRFNRPVQQWIREHGRGCIRGVLLEAHDHATCLPERERFWIECLDTFFPDNPDGLNVTRGGRGGMLGYRHTPEARQKIAEAGTGRVFARRTEAARARRQQAREAHCRQAGHERQEVTTSSGRTICALCASLSRLGKSSWNKGKPWPAEFVRKMSEDRMGQPAWNAGRQCTAEEIETNRLAQLTRYQVPEQRAIGRANLSKASHVRWHVNRNVVKPGCAHCDSGTA